MAEVWKDIPEYEGWYQVSNAGRVKRVRPSTNSYVDKILRPWLGGAGYPEVWITNEQTKGIDKRNKHSVHSLVATAFIGPRPQGLEINHKNGIKTDNHLSNLEYVTPTENMQHASETGLLIDANGRSRLTKDDVRAIRALAGQKKQIEIAKMFGVGQTHISAIVTRKKWAWLD